MNLRIVYLIAAFISLLALIFYYEINVSKVNKNYMLLFLTTLISNFGYAMYVHSDTLEVAMTGNLISYIGSIYTIFFGLIVMVELPTQACVVLNSHQSPLFQRICTPRMVRLRDYSAILRERAYRSS